MFKQDFTKKKLKWAAGEFSSLCAFKVGPCNRWMWAEVMNATCASGKKRKWNGGGEGGRIRGRRRDGRWEKGEAERIERSRRGGGEKEEEEKQKQLPHPLCEPPANFPLLRPKLSCQGYKKKEGHLLLSYLFFKKLRVQCSLLQHSLILTYYDSQPTLATVSTSQLMTTPSLKMFYLLFSLISNIQSISESYGSAFRKSNFDSHFPSDHHLSLGLCRGLKITLPASLSFSCSLISTQQLWFSWYVCQNFLTWWCQQCSCFKSPNQLLKTKQKNQYS